jgi:two-component system response regulator YesN
VEELLLIMNGDDREELQQDGLFLANLIQQDIEEGMGCRVSVGVGSVQQRLTDIYLSFAQALTAVNTPSHLQPEIQPNHNHLADMLKLDQTAVTQYLKSGLTADFNAFYAEHLQSVSEAALHSHLIKHYFFVDLVLTAVQFVTELGGDAREIIPAMDDIEGFLVNVKTSEQIKESLRELFSAALTFRNNQTQYEKAKLIFQAKDFINANFTDPNLLLNEVAAMVNLSPSHFSVVFGRETGESFKDYLTRVRIDRAKELLRTTNMKCSEVAFQSGYNDPHYFSYVFRKNTGLPPQQFRQLPRA